jgi:hypothetical protein
MSNFLSAYLFLEYLIFSWHLFLITFYLDGNKSSLRYFTYKLTVQENKKSFLWLNKANLVWKFTATIHTPGELNWLYSFSVPIEFLSFQSEVFIELHVCIPAAGTYYGVKGGLEYDMCRWTHKRDKIKAEWL